MPALPALAAADAGAADAADAVPGQRGFLIRVAGNAAAAGDYEAALMFFRRAARYDAASLPAHLGIARMLLLLDRSAEAVDAFTAASALAPADGEVLAGFGTAMILAGRAAESIPLLEQAARTRSSTAALNHLGLARSLVGDHDGAAAAYREGLAGAPEHKALQNNLGLALVLAGRYAEGEEILRELARDPAATGPTRNLALATVLTARFGSAGPPPALDADDSAIAAFAVLRPVPGGEENSVIYRSFALAGETAAMARPERRPPAAPAIAEPPAAPSAPPAVAVVPPAAPEPDPPPAPPAIAQKDAARFYQVQLGAYRTVEIAQAFWARVADAVAERLSGLEPSVEPVDLGPERGVHFRLRTPPLAHHAEAQAICDALKARDIDCYVLRRTPPADTVPLLGSVPPTAPVGEL